MAVCRGFVAYFGHKIVAAGRIRGVAVGEG